MLRIPVDTNGSASIRQRVNIDGTTVAMRLYWNETDGHWFADFESANGKRNGVRLVVRSRLLKANSTITGDGDFVIFQDDESDTAGLGFDNFGTSYGLYFLDDEDCVDLAAAGMV